MDIVNENSTAYLSVTFLDKTGTAVAPSTVNYWIDDLIAGTVVQASASLTPASTVEITLTPTHNTIRNGRAFEERRVTVEGTYAGGEAVREEYLYRVKNLGGVS